MKIGKTAGILGFAMLGAACAPSKGTIKMASHDSVRKHFVPMEEGHTVKAKWKKGECAVEDNNTISYTLKDKSRKVIRLSVEIYSDQEELLDIKCSDNNTTILTDRKVSIFPGLGSFEDSDEIRFDMILSHSLQGIGENGISSWNIQSGDCIFLITDDNRFWYMDLKTNDDILGFKLPQLHEGRKEMFYYRKILFIAQNTDEGREFLVAVRPIKGAEEIGMRTFTHDGRVSGRMEFSEKNSHLELKTGTETHNITVKQEGEMDTVFVD